MFSRMGWVGMCAIIPASNHRKKKSFTCFGKNITYYIISEEKLRAAQHINLTISWMTEIQFLSGPETVLGPIQPAIQQVWGVTFPMCKVAKT
jgi:hypothetical protein